MSEAQLEKVCILIERSMHAPVPEEYVKKRFQPGEKFCTEIHSHEFLDEIFATLWDEENPILVRGGFCDLVFRLIFFHQSLHGVDKWPPMVMTTAEERFKFCDPEFFALAVIIMANDSGSYTFLKDRELKQQADQEFIENNSKMVEEWRKLNTQ